MEQIAAQLAEPPEGVSSVEFARRSGVARTTIHRIANGTVEPTLSTLRELAIAHLFSLKLELVPLSDPLAAVALRVLVDPAFEKLDVEEVDPDDPADLEAWVERLRRFDDVDTAAVTAARASSLLHREGAVFLRGDHSGRRLASAGEASGQTWALSGAAGLEYVTGSPVEGPSILWVDEDAASAASLLLDTHRRVESAAGAHVIVARAHPAVFVDRHADGLLWYVAPTQLLLDSIGLGGAVEETAMLVQRSWSESEVA
jgi:transcriptional regulator with XRE-family HTH domain